MRPIFRAAAVLALFAASGIAPAAVALEVKLTPEPPAAVVLAGIDPAAHQGVRLLVEAFTEGRVGDPAAIGELRREGKPVEPLTTAGDVARMVTDRFLSTLGEAGLPVVDARQLAAWGAKIVDTARPVLTVRGELLAFSLVETKTLDAEVRLGVTIEDGAGKRLWSGSSSGHAGRSARSYKPEEYAPTLSDALDEAIGQLLRAESFVGALRGGG